jgi:molecular chaperone GrpE
MTPDATPPTDPDAPAAATALPIAGVTGVASEAASPPAGEEPSADASGPLPVEVVLDAAVAEAAVSAASSEVAALTTRVAALTARVTEVEGQLATAEKERKDNWDKYLRSVADVENLRKRQRREVDDTKHETRAKVLKEMLPVVDNLERAVDHAAGPGGEPASLTAILEGVQLVLRQFASAFERLEVVPIEALDKPFDPNLHEAISQADSDAAPGTVVQVLQRGYRAGERLLRPALVVVARAKT